MSRASTTVPTSKSSKKYLMVRVEFFILLLSLLAVGVSVIKKSKFFNSGPTVVGVYSYDTMSMSKDIVFERSCTFTGCTITATVRALVDKKWINVSTVSDDKIEVDMQSSTEKMQNRLLGDEQVKPIQKLSQLCTEQQDEILSNLKPIGTWRIDVEVTHFDLETKLGVVEYLVIYNSS